MDGTQSGPIVQRATDQQHTSFQEKATRQIRRFGKGEGERIMQGSLLFFNSWRIKTDGRSAVGYQVGGIKTSGSSTAIGLVLGVEARAVRGCDEWLPSLFL